MQCSLLFSWCRMSQRATVTYYINAVSIYGMEVLTDTRTGEYLIALHWCRTRGRCVPLPPIAGLSPLILNAAALDPIAVSPCLRTPCWRCTGCWERPGLLHLHNAQHQSTAGTLPAQCEHLSLNSPGTPLTCSSPLSNGNDRLFPQQPRPSLTTWQFSSPGASTLTLSTTHPSRLPLGSAHAASTLPGASQKAVNSDGRPPRLGGAVPPLGPRGPGLLARSGHDPTLLQLYFYFMNG